MVKCPKGTPSQIKANLARIKEIETFALENNILSHDENGKNKY